MKLKWTPARNAAKIGVRQIIDASSSITNGTGLIVFKADGTSRVKREVQETRTCSRQRFPDGGKCALSAIERERICRVQYLKYLKGRVLNELPIKADRLN